MAATQSPSNGQGWFTLNMTAWSRMSGSLKDFLHCQLRYLRRKKTLTRRVVKDLQTVCLLITLQLMKLLNFRINPLADELLVSPPVKVFIGICSPKNCKWLPIYRLWMTWIRWRCLSKWSKARLQSSVIKQKTRQYTRWSFQDWCSSTLMAPWSMRT